MPGLAEGAFARLNGGGGGSTEAEETVELDDGASVPEATGDEMEMAQEAAARGLEKAITTGNPKLIVRAFKAMNEACYGPGGSPMAPAEGDAEELDY